MTKATKGQLYIYNSILNNIQETDLTSAYVLGKKWKYTKNNFQFSSSAHSMLLISQPIDFRLCDVTILFRACLDRLLVNCFQQLNKKQCPSEHINQKKEEELDDMDFSSDLQQIAGAKY